jgi:hypothetical protein
MKRYLIATLLLLPSVSFAAPNLLTALQNLVIVLGDVVVPFLFGVAFLFFCINVFRFFVLEGHSEEGRKKAKDLAIYSVAAAVFLIIFWGIINLLVESSGVQGQDQPCPDYIQQYDPSKCP